MIVSPLYSLSSLAWRLIFITLPLVVMASRLSDLVRAEAEGGTFASFAYRKWTLRLACTDSDLAVQSRNHFYNARTNAKYIKPISLTRYPVTSQLSSFGNCRLWALVYCIPHAPYFKHWTESLIRASCQAQTQEHWGYTYQRLKARKQAPESTPHGRTSSKRT